MIVFNILAPIDFIIFFKDFKASISKGDSFLLAGAETKGATTLQFLSQKVTTLFPLILLCPLYPILSPPFFAAVVVPSP